MLTSATSKSAGLFVALAISSGCIFIPGGKPLSDPRVTHVDEDLCGVWRTTDQHHLAHYLFIGKCQAEGNPTLLKVVAVDYDEKTVDSPSQRTLYCSTTDLGEARYLNVFGPGDFGQPNSYQKWLSVIEKDADITKMAYLMKYRLKGGHLEVWWEGDDQVHTANLEAGRYRSDDVSSFARYLARTGGTTLFPDNNKSRYARLSAAHF